MIVAISSALVVRLSMRALTSPWRSSFSTRAPTIRTARPSTLSVTISRPRREPGNQRSRAGRWPVIELEGAPSARSGFAVSVSDAIEGFDRVELGVHVAELLAHALDVAVDRPVIDVDLIVVGGVQQVVAALHEAGTLGQRLQEQELGDGQLHRLSVPETVESGRVQGEL